MFTGIIEELGTVESLASNLLAVNAQRVLDGTQLGDSVSVNGACLTVTKMSKGSLSVEVMPETLRRSNIGSLTKGQRVNLERALTLASRVGGHMVQGHVDGTGKIMSIAREGNATLLTVSAPEAISRYLVEKAFIAVDGISLTVVACQGSSFTVSIVSTTLNNTTIGLSKPGRMVNLEVDVVAKYVEHFSKARGSGVTQEMLAEYGFRSSSGR